MANEEKNNQALISALSVSDSQPTVSTLIVPPDPHSVVATSSSATVSQSASTVVILAQDYPVIIMKLKIILRE